jgi:hypothetical protein
MGVVYAAWSVDGERVAVKVIRDDLRDDPAFRLRFEREATIAQRVRDRCTAEVVDADVHARVPYFATQYVPGPTLAEYVSMAGPLPPNELVALAAGLASGLRAMHAVGVVHRDLSPRNVILCDSGPKIIDFGIARHEAATTLTSEHVPIGTPMWMSPEQVLGEDVGPPSDVFVWGALVCFAATGEPPFAAQRADVAAYRTLLGAEPDLRLLPEALVPLLRGALQRDPAARPSAETLATMLTSTEGDASGDPALSDLLDRDWTVRAGGDEPWPKGPRLRARATVTVVAVLAFAIAAVAAVAWHGSRSGHASTGYARVVLADHPDAFYEFDDAHDATYADRSGHGYVLRAPAGATTSIGLLGRDDRSLRLDRGEYAATAASLSALEGDHSRTVELWFETRRRASQCLFSVGQQRHAAYLNICLTDGHDTRLPIQNVPGLFIATWDGDVYIPVAVGADEWHYLAVTIDGDRLVVDLDGSQPTGYVATRGAYAGLRGQPFELPFEPATAATPVDVGGSTSGSGLLGAIDEVAIYPSALPEGELVQHEVVGARSVPSVGPTVQRVEPPSGPQRAHTKVTIRGTGFRQGQAPPAVSFALASDGTRRGTDVQVLDDTRLTVESPSVVATGFFDIPSEVHVSVDGAVSRASGASFVFSYPAPSITSVSFTGKPESPTITIHGRGFGSAQQPVPFICGRIGASDTGFDYPWNALSIGDTSVSLFAGKDGDCVGLTHLRYSDTSITFGLGVTFTGRNMFLPGHHYAVIVKNARALGVVRYDR